MLEKPPINSNESDLAKGLAEFRQGRKSLLPEFELPTDDIKKEEIEIVPERLMAYSLEKLLGELNLDTKLKDPKFLEILASTIGSYFKADTVSPWYEFHTLDAIYFLGIKLPGLSYDDLDSKINQSGFLAKLAEHLKHDIKESSENAMSAAFLCWGISTINFLEIKIPGLDPNELNLIINNPDRLKQLFEYLDDELELGKVDPNSATLACKTLSAIHSLGIKLPELNYEDQDSKLCDPELLKQLFSQINDDLTINHSKGSDLAWACQVLFSIKNLIKYYSAIADEKEATLAAHRLQTAANRTGVPPRPETKAF